MPQLFLWGRNRGRINSSYDTESLSRRKPDTDEESLSAEKADGLRTVISVILQIKRGSIPGIILSNAI